MEKIMLDLTSLEKKTEVENACRAQILADLMEFLSSRYEGVRRSNATEFTFPIAMATDPDGFTVDVGALVSVKIPKYYNVETEKRKTKAYNIVNAVYEWEIDTKTEKKLKKEAEALEIAKKFIIPAPPFEYDFDEVDFDEMD